MQKLLSSSTFQYKLNGNSFKFSLLKTMVTHGRVELLAHPLSQKYLQMKWNSYGKYFHLANLLIYSVFLLFVTVYSSLMMNDIKIQNRQMNSEQLRENE